jgi:hypothetical protein
MNEQLPFLLKQGEKIILDAGSVQYYGIGITNIGFFGGGTLGRGFGGIATGTQVKREKSSLDAVNCHVYLTNSRIVFIKAKLSLLSMNKETKLENIFSEIPLEAIEGIYSGSKVLNPTVELAVKSPNGEINRIAFAFLAVTFTWTVKRKRDVERDEWIKAITKCKADLSEKLPMENKENPLEILKLRYAKGELTKEEYDQIKKDLSE